MDRTLFVSLLNNLLHMNVTVVDREESLMQFERQYCYTAVLQPMFTEAALSRVLADAEERVICESRDALGICVLSFRADGQSFLLGPYIRRSVSAEDIRSALIHVGLPVSYAPSVRMYVSAFPQISSSQVKLALIACLRAFVGGEDYIAVRVDRLPDGVAAKPKTSFYQEVLDYSSLHKRYDTENHFLHMIETGDTEHVLTAFYEVTRLSVDNTCYVNAIFQDPMVSLSMIRALARKAAERGGASIEEVNEITQRSVQQMLAVGDIREQVECCQRMIMELTEAVRRFREYDSRYTAPVRKVISYLRMNLSQEIGVEGLADMVQMSYTYLSRCFKKEVGVPISQYIAQLRCEQAADLLASTDLPVQEISAYVGYLDSNYFVKVFRKCYGLSPSVYRSQNRH